METTKETKAGHTPLPWRAVRVDSAKFNIQAGSDSVAAVYAHQGSPTINDRVGEGEANAQLICRAVNAHGALVAALECITAALTQSVQYSEPDDNMAALVGRINIMRGDCSMAVETAKRALALAQGGVK